MVGIRAIPTATIQAIAGLRGGPRAATAQRMAVRDPRPCADRSGVMPARRSPTAVVIMVSRAGGLAVCVARHEGPFTRGTTPATWRSPWIGGPACG